MPFESGIALIASGLIGSGFLARSLYLCAKVQTSQDWPHGLGKILAANLQTSSSGDGTTYAVEVQYEYCVNGVRYIGERIGFTPQTYIRFRRARQELDRYPVNSSVPVYYDPEKPADAVLQRQAPNTLLAVAAGIIFLAIAVGGWLGS